MKKRIISCLLVSVLVLSMLGCGESKATSGNTDTKAPEASVNEAQGEEKQEAADNGEKIVLRYTGWGGPQEKKTTQNVIDEFEKTHPNVEVEYIHIPTDYNTKLTTMIAANQGPDVALLNGDTALQWASEGKLKNMMDFAADDPEVNIDDILSQVVYWWDDGKACGVNGSLEIFGLFYNRDVFEEAGITVPTTEEEAWTWEEFLDVCQTLTIDNQGRNAKDPDFDPKNIKQFGLFAPSGANMVSYAMTYCGQDFLNEDGTAVNLLGTKGAEAMQNFADLITKYHVAPSPVQSKNLPGGATALASKKVAMVWDGQWALQEISANKVNFGVGIPPKMYDKPMTIAMGEPVVVFETTQHPEEAWELQKAFMNTEYTMELIETGLWMPVLREWYEDEALIDRWARNNPAHPDGYVDAIMNNGFKNGEPALTYSIKNFPKIMDVLNPKLDKVWLGEMTVEEAITSVEDQMNAQVQGKYPRP